MRLSDYRWRSGSEDVLGGIDCFWLSSEEHAAAQVRVYAYPESVVPTSVREALTPGCGLTDWGETECYASGVQGGRGSWSASEAETGARLMRRFSS